MWADFLQHTGAAGDVHVPLPNKAYRYSNSQESPCGIDSLSKSFSEIYTDDDLQLQRREAGIVDSWRNWNDLEQLATLSGFNSYGRRIFDSVFEVSNVLTQDFTIQKYIIQQAHKYYKYVKDGLQSLEYYNRGIQWLADHTAPHEDRVVSMFLKFVQIGLSYKANHRPKYQAVCRMFLSADSPAQMTADAFHQMPEKQRDVSDLLISKISECFVAAGMANTFICREKNISPLGLFNIEAKSELSTYRKRLHQCVNFPYQDSQVTSRSSDTDRPSTNSVRCYRRQEFRL